MQCLTCSTSGAGSNLSVQDVYICICQSQLIACAAQLHSESISHGDHPPMALLRGIFRGLLVTSPCVQPHHH